MKPVNFLLICLLVFLLNLMLYFACQKAVRLEARQNRPAAGQSNLSPEFSRLFKGQYQKKSGSREDSTGKNGFYNCADLR